MSVKTIFIVSRVTEFIFVDCKLNERLRLLGDLLAKDREDNRRSYDHEGASRPAPVPVRCRRCATGASSASRCRSRAPKVRGPPHLLVPGGGRRLHVKSSCPTALSRSAMTMKSYGRRSVLYLYWRMDREMGGAMVALTHPPGPKAQRRRARPRSGPLVLAAALRSGRSASAALAPTAGPRSAPWVSWRCQATWATSARSS